MVSPINNITLQGNLVRNPRLRYTARQTPVVEFTVAHNRRHREQRSGDFVDSVSYFNCRAFGNDAVAISRLFEKGDTVGICGRLQQDRWIGRDKTTRDRVFVVIADYELIQKPPRCREKVALTPAPMLDLTTKVFDSSGELHATN